MVHAQTGQSEAKFDIESQPLTSALVAYARIARIEILVDDGVVAGRRSSAVRGTFHPTIALRGLLARTDLEIRYVDRDTVTLVPRQPPASSPDRRDDQTMPFTLALQASFARAICNDHGPRPLRVAAQLWIGPAGTILHSMLLESTGDEQRDASIMRRLDGLVIGSALPDRLPQPATVVFTARSIDDCARHAARLP